MPIISMPMLFYIHPHTEMIPQRLSQALLGAANSAWMVLVAINIIADGGNFFRGRIR